MTITQPVYVYTVFDDLSPTYGPLATFTIKTELVDWLKNSDPRPPHPSLRVFRSHDGHPGDQTSALNVTELMESSE